MFHMEKRSRNMLIIIIIIIEVFAAQDRCMDNGRNNGYLNKHVTGVWSLTISLERVFVKITLIELVCFNLV